MSSEHSWQQGSHFGLGMAAPSPLPPCEGGGASLSALRAMCFSTGGAYAGAADPMPRRHFRPGFCFLAARSSGKTLRQPASTPTQPSALAWDRGKFHPHCTQCGGTAAAQSAPLYKRAWNPTLDSRTKGRRRNRRFRGSMPLAPAFRCSLHEAHFGKLFVCFNSRS
jgi:hypothetical protein